MQIPHDKLTPDVLEKLIESFVLREGTDYGEREASLSAKVEAVRRQLERGDAVVVFDPDDQSVSIVPSN